MRLINTVTFQLEEFEGVNTPKYAILSHRWQEEEVLYKDIMNGTAATKKGYTKIVKFCELARSYFMEYAWCDTCCIDKSSSAELSEYINSLYECYRYAYICFAYLFDVHTEPVRYPNSYKIMEFGSEFLIELYDSQWFKRSWTLQELIAPERMEFFNSTWIGIGDRYHLSTALSYATSIPAEVLDQQRDFDLGQYSTSQKFSWAAHRVATRVEDIAYSLLGIFGVNLPMLYGEGKFAFRRLQEEILRRSEDDSFLAYDHTEGVLAESPLNFACHLPYFSTEQKLSASPEMTVEIPAEPYCLIDEPQVLNLSNAGLHFQRPVIKYCHDTYLLGLRTFIGRDRSEYQAHIFVKFDAQTGRFCRAPLYGHTFRYLPADFQKKIKMKGVVSRPPLEFGNNQVISTTQMFAPEACIQGPKTDVYRIELQHELSFSLNRHMPVPLRPSDVLTRLCWLTERSTVALAGNEPDEAIAILRVKRGHDRFYIHIGLNGHGLHCLLMRPSRWLPAGAYGDSMSMTFETTLSSATFLRTDTDLYGHICRLTIALRASAKLLNLEASPRDGNEVRIVAQHNTVFDIGIPDFKVRTQIENRQCIFTFIDTGTDVLPFQVNEPV